MQLSDLDLSGRYSYADYLKWQFRERVELILGKIFLMSPAPSAEHQEISSRLHLAIGNFIRQERCKIFAAPFDVRLLLPSAEAPDEQVQTVVQPDLCVICDLQKIDRRGCVGAPEWVIEILSPGNSQKEMREKYAVYEQAGVQEYWLVNPLEKAVLVYVRREGEFVGKRPFVTGDRLAPELFPELEIPLAEIFPEGYD